jgi:CubicO group peptidase (beta-lactamase class C family)
MPTKHISALFLGACLSLTAHAVPPCLLLGPDFPAPRKLSSSPAIQSAIANLTQVLDQTLSMNISSYGPFDAYNTSFSLEIFSTHEEAPLFINHTTAPAVSGFGAGTKSVNSNTTYRIGSVTKLFTVYTFLIQAGDKKWSDPITKYIPELEAAASCFNATQDSLDLVAWEDVTIGDLASQMADIGRDYSGFGELELLGEESPMDGLPPLNASDVPSCAGGAGCDRAQFFAGFTKRHPVYAPGTAAIYSNAAYMILSYALENITGKAFPRLIQESLFEPLTLSSGTSWTIPEDNSTSIIPPNGAFALDLGDETA